MMSIDLNPEIPKGTAFFGNRLSFNYLMVEPTVKSPEVAGEFAEVYHEPDEPPVEPEDKRRQWRRERPLVEKRNEAFKRTRLRNKLRAILITVQPDCYVCGKPLQVTDPTKVNN